MSPFLEIVLLTPLNDKKLLSRRWIGQKDKHGKKKHPRIKGELYNHATDPLELNNLINDKKSKKVYQTLLQLLKEKAFMYRDD